MKYEIEHKYSTIETSPHHRLGRRLCFIIQPLVSAHLANQDVCCLWLWSEPLGCFLSLCPPPKLQQNKLKDIVFSFTF